MRNLIVAALILQLVITVIEVNGYEFGDIIGFQRFCVNSPLFMHFGIYVGNEPFDGKKNDQDIFHITGPALTKTLSKCTFGKMSRLERKKGPAIVFNFLDRVETVGTKQEIRDRINENLNQKNCKMWNPFTNNCEHLATYVRYGEKVSLQTCQFFDFVPRNNKKYSSEDMKDFKLQFEQAVAEACALKKERKNG